MKKFLGLFSLLLMAFVLVGCKLGKASDLTYMAIDVNPSVELLFNEKKIVVTFAALNEEAEVVIEGNTFVGLPVNVAIEAYLNELIETGFIDVDTDDNAVLITVANADGEAVEDEEMDDMCNTVEGYFARNRVKAAVVKNKEFNAQIKTNAKGLNVSPGKYQLAKRASESDDADLTVEEAANLPVKDLIKRIKRAHERIEEEEGGGGGGAAGDRALIKAELKAECQIRVNAHRAALGTEEQIEEGEEWPPLPDYALIKERLREHKTEIAGSYETRTRDRIKEAREECGLPPRDDANKPRPNPPYAPIEDDETEAPIEDNDRPAPPQTEEVVPEGPTQEPAEEAPIEDDPTSVQ
ncbi:MAG: anti-sigma-I factor RsgI family protein [Bacilli bacterium]|jgi:hypothetical protein